MRRHECGAQVVDPAAPRRDSPDRHVAEKHNAGDQQQPGRGADAVGDEVDGDRRIEAYPCHEQPRRAADLAAARMGHGIHQPAKVSVEKTARSATDSTGQP